MRKSFDDFVYYLTELLNHTFSQKGGWFLSDNRFNRLGATIEHENGVRFELYDEEVNNSSDVTLIVEYPNGKSKWLGYFWQKDLIDIADKMYEYAVVKNHVSYKESKLKRNRKLESSGDEMREFMDINNELIQIMRNACSKVDDFAFLCRSLGDLIPSKAREEVEHICGNILSLERMLRDLRY